MSCVSMCCLWGSCLSLVGFCFGRVVGEGESLCVFSSFLAFSALNVSVSCVAVLTGDGFVSAIKAVLLMFGAPER